MKLMTKEIEKKLKQSPFGSHEDEGENAKVIVKFFNPYGAGTWLITEGEQEEDGDWLLFGKMHIFDWEWGYVSLSELEKTKVNIFGMSLPLERDMYCTGSVADNC
jgi:hypothetical protein